MVPKKFRKILREEVCGCLYTHFPSCREIRHMNGDSVVPSTPRTDRAYVPPSPATAAEDLETIGLDNLEDHSPHHPTSPTKNGLLRNFDQKSTFSTF